MEINSRTETYDALKDGQLKQMQSLTIEFREIKDKEDVKKAIQALNSMFKTFCQ